MKKIILSSIFLMSMSFGFAQLKTPAASPKSVVNQTVGLTEVKVEYSRPSAKGRNVFGNLVPFGKVWRTGANANTIISFSDDVVIDGKTLPRGEYALYTIPRPDQWEIIFYKDINNWGTPDNWSDDKIALKTTSKVTTVSNPIETFSINFNTVDINYGTLDITWEKSLISVKFEVPTQSKALASIEKTLAGPDADTYYASANYFYQSNGDMNKALVWVDKAIELRGNDSAFWYLRLKSLIHAKLGNKKEAISAAKRSLDAAEKAGNADYVKLNKDSIAEWSK